MAEIARNLTINPAAPRPAMLDGFAQKLVLDRLAGLRHGRLDLSLPDGSVRVFGDAGRRATVHVHHPAFFRRLVAGGDIGAGESFMDGEWSTPDLVAVTRLLLDNEHLLESHRILGVVKRSADRVRHVVRRNTRAGARRNVAAHYDLSNELYGSFLDPSMTYSSAVFDSSLDSLEQAQVRKYDRLARMAGLRAGQHVLEIGCGWGGFAEYAASVLGCRVTGVTLSEEQARFARHRIAAAGLGDRVSIEVIDYRAVEGSFDAIVSIEMLEAVGHAYLPHFFAACERLLKPAGRVAVQVITIPDQLYETYRRGNDFIRRHIFPGGHLPSLKALQDAAASHSALVVQEVSNIAVHYAETLRRWRSRFTNRLPEIRDLGFDRRFCRMWEFYLATCEAAFDHGKLATLQIAFERPGGSVMNDLAAERRTGR